MGSCPKKGSLFMVKVKTAFCILCVYCPLFASQCSLSCDTRLWPSLGGTTRTGWVSTHYVDANLHHDLINGKAVTAILHRDNQLWKQQLLAQNLYLQGLLMTRSLTFTQHSCVLAYPSTPRATCLETTRQWSPMPPSLLPLIPRDPILVPTAEFKKQLQQAISSFIGRMENPTLQTSSLNIGDSPPFGLFDFPFFSGEEIFLTLPPSQRGVTGFQQNMSKSEAS